MSARRYVPRPRSTPTFANNKIYFTAPNGLLECLDASGGHSLWSVNVLQKFKGRGATFGYACSPVIEDNKVILPVGGPSASVIALDANTGRKMAETSEAAQNRIRSNRFTAK